MTREQQAAEARAIAAANPEWEVSADGYSLTRRPGGTGLVLYWPHADVWSGSGPFRDTEQPDAASAIRALGFTLNAPATTEER